MFPHKNNYHSFFDVEHHLSEMGIATYVDAMLNDLIAELPDQIIIHVQKCITCKGHVCAVYALEKMQNNLK